MLVRVQVSGQDSLSLPTILGAISLTIRSPLAVSGISLTPVYRASVCVFCMKSELSRSSDVHESGSTGGRCLSRRGSSVLTCRPLMDHSVSPGGRQTESSPHQAPLWGHLSRDTLTMTDEIDSWHSSLDHCWRLMSVASGQRHRRYTSYRLLTSQTSYLALLYTLRHPPLFPRLAEMIVVLAPS